MQKLKNISDILLIALIFVALVLNILIKNELLEAITLLLVVISFSASRFTLSRNVKDERLQQINFKAGYMSFALTIFGLMLTLTALHITEFTLGLREVVIYLSMFMMLTFAIFYAYLRRKL